MKRLYFMGYGFMSDRFMSYTLPTLYFFKWICVAVSQVDETNKFELLLRP